MFQFSDQCELSVTIVLHTPSTFTNLLFVQTLCHDNLVFIEFYSNSFHVKNLRTKKNILHGPIKNKLYEVIETVSEEEVDTSIYHIASKFDESSIFLTNVENSILV